MSSAAQDGLEPISLRRLRIENFRGFALAVELDLSASVVILRGPNGVGKTSVFDAIQWLLVGDVERLETRRLRKTDEHLVNSYRLGQRASVTAWLASSGGEATVNRTGDRSGSVLSWTTPDGDVFRGPAALEALASAFGATSDASLATTLHAAGLLQQDDSRIILEKSPRERFAQFSQLLGLGGLERFETWAQSRSRAAQSIFKETQATEARLQGQLNDKRYQLRQLQEVTQARPALREVEARLLAALALHSPRPTTQSIDRDEAAALAAAATKLSRSCVEIAAQMRSLATSAAMPPDGTDSDSIQRSLEEVRAEVLAQRGALTAALQARTALEAAQESLQTMAAAVLPHISDSTCPVCQQSIDETRVRAHLLELGGRTPEILTLTASIDDLRQALQTSEAKADDVERRLHAKRAEEAARAEFQRRQELVNRELHEVLNSPSELTIGVAGLTPDAAALEAAGHSLQQLATLSREMVVAIDAGRSGAETSLEQDIQILEDQMSVVRARLEEEARVAASAAALLEAARQARLDIVEQQMALLTPIAQNVYSRMDPHPTFTEIQLVSELFRAAGTTTAQVFDERADVSANPMLVFSAAQANIAALSYLVALNWAAGGRVPTLLLDDPLQAMDDLNVLGFADLCRHLRRGRQLIISTHEKRFAELLERKLAPRLPGQRTVVVDFNGWDRNGPDVKVREIPEQFREGALRVLGS
jgi:DNA repair exonuclease SbcCD ATPase subunit